MASRARPLVKFLTSPGCQLCKPAFFLLQRVHRERDDFDIKVVNINERKYADAYGQYCHDLPVVLHESTVLAKFKVTDAALRDAIAKVVSSHTAAPGGADCGDAEAGKKK